LGYCARRKSRVAIARKFSDQEIEQSKNSPEMARLEREKKLEPFPFRKIGRSMLIATEFSDIPTASFLGSPPEVWKHLII